VQVVRARLIGQAQQGDAGAPQVFQVAEQLFDDEMALVVVDGQRRL
jgi:hypothetical protein